MRLLSVPNQIAIAVFPKLTLYGCWRFEGRFTELLKILENGGALRQAPARLVGVGPA